MTYQMVESDLDSWSLTLLGRGWTRLVLLGTLSLSLMRRRFHLKLHLSSRLEFPASEVDGFAGGRDWERCKEKESYKGRKGKEKASSRDE